MTGVEIAEATLLTGQIINVLAVLTLYPLSVHLAKGSRWAGVGAVLIAGIVSPMPAYYVNWGRLRNLADRYCYQWLSISFWTLCIERDSLGVRFF
jgi:hypothetical protein